MKRFAFLLLFLACAVYSYSQERSYPLANIVGADTTYFWKIGRANNPMFVIFDYSGFSTDSVTVTPYLVFINEAKNDTICLWPNDYNGNPLQLITLSKALRQSVNNGDTTNAVGFSMSNFYADQLGFKVTPHDADETDVLKVYIRK